MYKLYYTQSNLSFLNFSTCTTAAMTAISTKPPAATPMILGIVHTHPSESVLVVITKLLLSFEPNSYTSFIQKMIENFGEK